MVLINNLTIDEINAALIHLQRSKTEVVGGEKGNTIQNITINNSGSGASVPDFTVTIQLIQERLAELGATDDEIKAQIETLKQTIQTLTSNNVAGVRFEEETRRLFIILEDGDSYYTEITSEEINLVYDSDTDKLVLTMGLQRKEVTLPYIKEIEKGVAGGVASLDNTGRVPYSQLPESAMEFKGEWDASTNTPHLADGTGVNGDFYIVSTGGTVNFGTQAEPREITFYPNDRVIYEGDTDLWVRLPAGAVVSVNGMSGAVVLDATNIMYDANQTIKQKIDSAAQADWTQTNSSDPSFIKHKIPIWITSGAADDNMTPIDSVTSGEMRPVTSNAVAGALGWKLVGEVRGSVSIPINFDNYDEVLIIASMGYYVYGTVYVCSQSFPASYLKTHLGTYAWGYGGTLNSSTPYGYRARISVSSNSILPDQSLYDDGNQLGNTLFSVYAR